MLSDEEWYILDLYARLNADGKKYLRITIETLNCNDNMVKPLYTQTGNIITLK